MILGTRVTARQAAAALDGLARWLRPGERVYLVARTSRLRPFVDLLVVTDSRLLGLCLETVVEHGPQLAVTVDEVVGYAVCITLTEPRRLVVVTRSGKASFGNLDRGDVAKVLAVIDECLPAT